LIHSVFSPYDIAGLSGPRIEKEKTNKRSFQNPSDRHQPVIHHWRNADVCQILRDFALEEAHIEAEEVRTIIEGYFEGRANVLVHLDPCSDPDCPVCRRHACKLRASEKSDPTPWNVETLISQKPGSPPLWEI